MKKLTKVNKAATNTVRAFHSCACSCNQNCGKNWLTKAARSKSGPRDINQVNG
jgi:putative bacteriocin precursor